MTKVSKESVDYSKGMPESHCGICRHFEPPHSCEVVEGRIEASMWCKRFVRDRTRRYGKR